MFEVLLKIISQKEVYGIIFVIAAGYIVYRFSGLVLEKIINSGKTELEKKKRNTIVRLFQNIFRYVVFIVIALIILELYGVNTKSLIAGLGVAGAVLGLALQDTLKDLINGITIILENYYVVGDNITYEGFTGEVIELGLKTTKIKDIDGQVKIIANRNITEVINISQKNPCFTLEIPTSYDNNIEDVEKVLIKCATDLKKHKEIKDAQYLGIEEFADSSINYSFRVWCKRETQWAMKRLALKIIKESYDSNNLIIPYQQIEVRDAKKV